jgi:DNA polymerase III sliding clamp (beta) subunit (PCNA family)
LQIFTRTSSELEGLTDREVFWILEQVLLYVYGFKYDEITRVSGLSYSAAASRLHKAKKRIKALIDGYIPPSDAGPAIMALSGGMEDMKLGFSTDILEGIRAVEYAQNIEDEKRQFLCGVNLEYTREHGLRLIATDGKRLAVAQLPSDGAEEDMSITIPTEELGILKEAMEGKSAAVSVGQIDENLAAFYIDDGKKLVKLISAKFPDYRVVIFYPRIYSKSVTIERKLAIDAMEKVIEASEGNSPSDWIQWSDVMYISHASDILAMREITDRAMELCHTLLGFIARSAFPKELADNIFTHLPREEYQKLLEELEKRKAPPSEPVGTLKILASEGEAEFAGRFNSHFLLDAFRAMTGDAVKIRYRMDGRITQHSVLLEDDTDNIHILMPMKVE